MMTLSPGCFYVQIQLFKHIPNNREVHMAKFNKTVTNTGARDVLNATTSVPSARTYEGGAGYAKDQKGEFFSLIVNLMGGGEDTFYEKGKIRDDRAGKLAATIALEDPTWILGCLPWVRGTANMRTAPLI